MGNAQAKSGLVREHLNMLQNNDHLKEHRQEDDCQVSDLNDRGAKKDLSNTFCGTHETLVSEGGEADLHKHLVGCKKNPGHKQFVPVKDLNINHLPEGYRDNLLLKFIMATADLTVRVAVTMTSTQRPEFWPDTKQPYHFYDMRGSDVMRVGTGMVKMLNIVYNSNCPCHKCQHSDTPCILKGEVEMDTARHVVFDNNEASHTTCRLFYDGKQDSPLVTLDGWTVVESNTKEDRCKLKCVTYDADLLNKLYNVWIQWYILFKEVNGKYTRRGVKLILIVSHPHGCPKQLSVGDCLDRDDERDGVFHNTKYTYTTSTCPGSSGAYVHTLGYLGWLFNHHVHSGVNSERRNFCGMGQEL